MATAGGADRASTTSGATARRARVLGCDMAFPFGRVITPQERAPVHADTPRRVGRYASAGISTQSGRYSSGVRTTTPATAAARAWTRESLLREPGAGAGERVRSGIGRGGGDGRAHVVVPCLPARSGLGW